MKKAGYRQIPKIVFGDDVKHIISVVILFFPIFLSADVKSTTGEIKFDSNSDNQFEMLLNQTGLGIGINPSANLHIQGNALITDHLNIGTNNGSSNLNLSGTLGYSFQSVSSNTTLGNHSVVLSDTSGTNIHLTLPSASDVNGRVYTLKKTNANHQLWIQASDNIDNQNGHLELTVPSQGLSYAKLISDGSQWFVLDQSDDVLNVIGADNLIGWWKLDETSGSKAFDSSIHAHHATLESSMSFSTNSLTGQIGRALSFDDVDDEVTIDDPNQFNHTDFSCTGWFKTAESPYPNIVGRQYSNNKGWTAHVGGGSVLKVRIDSDTAINQTKSTAGTPNDNQWHFFGIVINGSSNKVYVYLDGSGGTEQSFTGNISGSNGHFGFALPTVGASRFGGEIDDVRYYNRLLSSEEIQEVYNQGL
jgi:hypothetical protein